MIGKSEAASPLEAFLAELRASSYSPRSLAAYEPIIRRALAHGDLLSYLNSSTASASYVSYQGRTLKRFCRWAVERGFMMTNPLAGLKFRVPPFKPVRPFTVEELARMLAACQTPKHRAALLLLIDSGIRASELAALKASDVDLESGVIQVMGKGQKPRQIAISEKTREALKAQMETNGTGCIWGSMTRKALHSMVKRIGRRAGVEEVYPHRFRHTFAHFWLQAGGQESDLMKLAGWSSLAMLRRYSAYFETERALAAHQRYTPVAALA